MREREFFAINLLIRFWKQTILSVIMVFCARITHLYLYHNDNSFGLRALHLLHSKAHIGYLSDPNAAEKRTRCSYIDLVRYNFDTIRDMFCRFAWGNRSTACLDTRCTGHFLAYNALDMMCMIVVLPLFKMKWNVIWVKDFVWVLHKNCVRHHFRTNPKKE